MSSAAEIVQSALLAGTWSNYTWSTTTEGIYIIGQEKIESKEVRIELEDLEGGEFTQDHKNTVLFSRQRCSLEIITRNTTDRDNIFKDVKDILAANTSYSFMIRDGSHKNPTRNRKNIDLEIEVLIPE